MLLSAMYFLSAAFSAGTLADPARSAMMLNKYKAQATMKTAADTPYKDTLDKLKY